MNSFSQTDTLEQLLSARYSCRAFLPASVPQSTMERMLELARRTPSWCNAQPWHVTIASGAATEGFRQVMLETCGKEPKPDLPFPSSYEGVYQQRRRECGLQLYESVGIAKGDRAASARQGMENFRFFGAPHVAIVSTPVALGVYGAVDCGSFVNNFMLAARSLGVASIAQAALATQGAVVREHFGIPDDRSVVCGISFGYEDTAHPANQFRTLRASVHDMVTWRE